MVVRIFLVMLVLAGCVADEADQRSQTIRVMPTLHVTTLPPEAVQPPDVCAEAADLPADDICALMCDPDAMKAELEAQGLHTGTCYEFSCPLPNGSEISVGVCLPQGN
jgi:hypothetical protein